MNKTYFIELAEFNSWANNAMISWCDRISDEQWNLPVANSFPGVRATVLHIVAAQTTWLNRLNNQGHAPFWSPDGFTGTKKEILDLLAETSEGYRKFINVFDEEKLPAIIKFTRANGKEEKIANYQVLAHVFNHSTYHRGQVVTMLRQIGFTQVTATDLAAFYFNSKS